MSSSETVCAECGAVLVAGYGRCWLCHRKVESGRSENPYSAPRPTGEVSPVQFSLESLFLVTTLVAVGLGVFLLVPGLGILLAVVAIPALVRTLAAGYRKRQAGVQLSAGQKIGTFLLSFFLILAIGFAGCIAFFLVCLGTGLTALAAGADGGDAMLITVVTLSGLVAISFAGWLLWVSRPRPA
jgi:hypothetical protein